MGFNTKKHGFKEIKMWCKNSLLWCKLNCSLDHAHLSQYDLQDVSYLYHVSLCRSWKVSFTSPLNVYMYTSKFDLLTIRIVIKYFYDVVWVTCHAYFFSMHDQGSQVLRRSRKINSDLAFNSLKNKQIITLMLVYLIWGYFGSWFSSYLKVVVLILSYDRRQYRGPAMYILDLHKQSSRTVCRLNCRRKQWDLVVKTLPQLWSYFNVWTAIGLQSRTHHQFPHRPWP